MGSTPQNMLGSPYADRLSADERAAMREFWTFYDPRRASITARLRSAADRLPEWSCVLSMSPPTGACDQGPRTDDLQMRAVLADEWEPYLASLEARGERYAEAGVHYAAWFGLIQLFRREVQLQLQEPDRNRRPDLPSVLRISRGLNQFVDIAIERIGEAYFAAQQRLVARIDAPYRAAFDRSPLPMWMFDRDTLRFVMVNEAAVRHYGYSRDEFLAMTLADLRRADDLDALRDDVSRAHGISEAKAWQHRKKDGTTISVEIRADDFDLNGRRVRLVLITDVTDRVAAEDALRKTQDQLRHAQKMEAIGRLAGGVAHDLNNILTVVQSFAYMLEETLDASDARREDAAEIRRASERAHALTEQLLTLSRHSPVARNPLDLDDVVAGFGPTLRRLLGETVKLVTHRGGVPKVLADRGQLEQVLMNLAVNARDAMPEGGRLTIESRAVDIDADTAIARQLRPGRYVELAVSDTGAGMDPETLSRIFDPFFTTKELGKGTGLGLAIVHGIVSQAGGAISVYSEPGHGTTFRIHLPVTDCVLVVPPPAVVVAPRTLPPMRILVVEDHADVRSVAVRILHDAGSRVIEAATADEARKVCVSDEGTIDLALLDVVLPDAQGDIVARQLCELRPDLKVVQMSGYPTGAISRSGAFTANVLTKPFSPAELRAAVGRACGLLDTGAAADRARSATRSKSAHRVLIVDDDELFRRSAVRMLRAADFDVIDVDGGSKALSALETMPVDVVVSDVCMPDGDGLELLRAVRRVDLDVAVILITGEPSVAAAARAVEHGAFRYLTKPVEYAALVKIVEHAARASALARLRREAFGISGKQAGAADRAGLEARFEQALEGLWMAFQPIVHARAGALFGVEALLRTSESSLATPPALLDVACQLGRLPLVGRKVRTLCGTIIAERADIALFVNLHPDDLNDIDLIDENAPLSRVASRVILEVTERASLDKSRTLVERVARLRELGFRLAVDDIGAGYSGLTSFTQLTPEFVKIDMSLVRDVSTSSVKQRTIGALCRLCHEVGALVVGEGVETIDERDTLIHLGCDLLQGFLTGRPDRLLAQRTGTSPRR